MGKPKKRKPKMAMPKSIMAVKVFAPMYNLLNGILKGEVDEVEGAVVVHSRWLEGAEFLEASETITVWCSTFNSICSNLGIPPVKTEALLSISEWLSESNAHGSVYSDVAVHEKDVREAKLELDTMYNLWIATPLDKIRIAVEPAYKKAMEDLHEDSEEVVAA